jgi:hypothetical protein
MMVKSGYLRIGRFRGASLRLHWSVPLGVLARARRRLEAGDEARALSGSAGAASPPRLRATGELDSHDLPPMPDEVRRVLDRIMAEGRAQHESAKKK